MSKHLHRVAVAVVLAAACGKAPPSPSMVPAADRARAVQVQTTADLITGPKASGQVGDFLIANTKVHFIVEAAGRSRSWFPTGGALLDADRVRPTGGEDRLQEMVTRLGNLGILYAESVTVANDGSDGNPAVIRVTGHDIPVPILQSVAPQARINVHAVTEYRLAPYADSLEIATTVTEESGAARNVPVGDMFILGDYVTLYAPSLGSDRARLSFATGVRYVAAYGGAVSYGYVSPRTKLVLIIPQAEIFGAGTGQVHLDAKGTGSFTRDLVVGTGDVAALLPEIVRREGGDPTALATLDGSITEKSTGAAVAGATVELSDGNGTYSLAVSDAMGHYHAPLEAQHYGITVSAPNRGSGTGASLDAVAKTAAQTNLQVGDSGKLSVQIVDDHGHPTPARLQITSTSGGWSGQLLSYDGSGSALIPPGSYRAIVSRGYEWESATVLFTVSAGKSTPVMATLSHVVDATGYVALDSHTHTAISVDSQLDPHERVAQALADGVEVVITTDHDVMFDLSPILGDMGIGAGTLATVIGTEISPVPGHINGYPVSPGPMTDTAGYWPVKWWSEDAQEAFIEDLWPPAIFAGMRNKIGAEVVQINHPRSGQGLLNWVGYDPKAGVAAVDAAHFDMNWDALEICNAGCNAAAGSEDDRALHDWWSFLNQGYARTAVGVSDAHVSTNFLGRARSMVALPGADLGHLDVHALFASLKAGHVVVLDGAFVTASIKDDGGAEVGPGGLAKATGAQLTLHVKVQAPSWIPVDSIRVVSNGATVGGMAIPASTPPRTVRFDGALPLPAPTADAWYVVIVDGANPMAPVLNAPPRTITNAIFVDRNANGKFDPPGL